METSGFGHIFHANLPNDTLCGTMLSDSENVLGRRDDFVAAYDDNDERDESESDSSDEDDAPTPPAGNIFLNNNAADAQVSPLAANQQQAQMEGSESRRASVMNMTLNGAPLSRRESESSMFADTRAAVLPSTLSSSVAYNLQQTNSRLSDMHVDAEGQNKQNKSASSPKKYYREPSKRVFVNRSLKMGSIKFYGFDMDYTLALYKSPEYEQMGFECILERLINIGYPDELRGYQYDPSFPIRGLWFDTLYGNLLKCDQFGHIMVCVHGFQFLKSSEVEQLYPNKFVVREEGGRLYIMNTLFNLPEIYLLACIVDYFVSLPGAVKAANGVKSGNAFYSYRSVFQDVRNAVDYVHMMGDLKEKTVANLDRFIVQDERLPVMLDRIRETGAKVFLLTNSEYEYTEKIMNYLFDIPNVPANRAWKSYFDAIVVDAKKPLFFGSGTLLREVDLNTGKLRLGQHQGPLEQERVYSGGSCDAFTKMIGAHGKDVLYIGDHIFGDILKSKKTRGWRTFLIVPELAHELSVWVEHHEIFYTLERLDTQLTNIYKNLDSSSTDVPDIRNIRKSMRESIHQMDMSYGKLGSLFRSGSRQTFFAAQVSRYADLYASSCINLLSYPFCYMFRSPAQLLPHESTVGHQNPSNIDSGSETPKCTANVLGQARRKHTTSSIMSDFDDFSYMNHQHRSSPGGAVLQKTFPDVPQSLTQAADEYYEDDEVLQTFSDKSLPHMSDSSSMSVGSDLLMSSSQFSPSAGMLVQQQNTDAFLHSKP